MPEDSQDFVGFPEGGVPKRFQPLIQETMDKIFSELTEDERLRINALNPDAQIGRFEATININVDEDLSISLKVYCGNLDELQRIKDKVKKALTGN